MKYENRFLTICILVCLLIICGYVAQAKDYSKQTSLSDTDTQTIVAAIYKLEGGAKTKYPYGVMSIDTKGDTAKAKRICENTVRNNFKRWQKTDKKTDFLTYLANVYCPKVADPAGNRNWIANIHKIVK